MNSHPHFHLAEPAVVMSLSDTLYQSKATGQYVIVQRRERETVALPAMHNGSRLSVQAEPIGWGEDTYDALEAVHKQR